MKMKNNQFAKPKVKAKKGTFGRLIKYLFKKYTAQIVTVLVCLTFSAIAGIIASIFMQKLTDEVIMPGIGLGLSAVWNNLIAIAIQMVVVYIVGIISSFLYSRIMASVSPGIMLNFRKDMFSAMQRLPIKYFDTHAHGDIMSTYTNDVDALRQLISQSLPQFFASAISIVMTFCVMVFYSFWLTLVVILSLAAMLFITKKIGGASGKFMMAQQKSLAKEEGFIEEMINGQKVVKVFCHEQHAKEEFDTLNDKLFNDSDKANKFGNILGPILNNMGNLLYVLIAFIGGLLVQFKATNIGIGGMSTLTIGIIISFLSLSRQLSQTVGQVSQQVSMVAMGLAGADRIFALLDEQPEQDNGYVTLTKVTKDENGNYLETSDKNGEYAWKHFHKAENTTTFSILKGDVQLDHVDFGYIPEKLVLKDVTIDAKAGQKIAFVGATGAGKTTITNLINRFYDIQDGKIRYDGININKIKKADLRKSLGIVLQDTNLFTGTVMENIRYGNLDATDEECIASAKLANAHDFITRLPHGYETMLTNNGANLSQGQRQLLSIARAAVADAPAMILDEATSSIDTRTEALVQDGMDKLMSGRTVFVIAHRLSTVRNSDVIMVLDKGQVIEKGSHDQLMALRGTYFKLYTGAFELE